MKTHKKRLLRIEEVVNEEEGLTEQDVELILSCMPKDFADAVRKKLCETTEEQIIARKYSQSVAKLNKKNCRSGLHGKRLELILSSLPPEYAAAVKSKLGI